MKKIYATLCLLALSQAVFADGWPQGAIPQEQLPLHPTSAGYCWNSFNCTTSMIETAARNHANTAYCIYVDGVRQCAAPRGTFKEVHRAKYSNNRYQGEFHILLVLTNEVNNINSDYWQISGKHLSGNSCNTHEWDSTITVPER